MNSSSSDNPTVIPEPDIALSISPDVGVKWTLLSARLCEGISELDDHEIEVACDDAFVDLASVLGARVSIEVTRGPVGRRFHGIVRRVEDGGVSHDDRAVLRLFVVPELWLLSQRRDSRIFAGKTTLEIVRDVLTRAAVHIGDALIVRVDESAAGPLRRREYCVQYQETDLDFVRRLLEIEGLSFYFEHSESREQLVIADDGRTATGDVFPELTTERSDGHIVMASASAAATSNEQSITRFETCLEVGVNAVELRDHDFSNPRRGATSVRVPASVDGVRRESYEHPAELVLVSADRAIEAGGGSATTIPFQELSPIPLPSLPAPRYDAHSGGTFATARLQERVGRARLMRGAGNVTQLAPGHRFQLLDHRRAELLAPYLVTHVEHRIVVNEATYRAEREGDVHTRYENTFMCMPRNAVFRPARTTQRPRIQGSQTATVVGGPGDELLTDYYGRVKVQFHWDREHACDDHLSGGSGPPETHDPATLCWVRCAQATAGPRWGTMFIPRVGMEVVVIFLDGDPDRPLVVGCVYNEANHPPYGLPQQYPRSTIKTRSIPSAVKPPGRDGFNELRFDDTALREQIFLHAEKNLTEIVRDHHETSVGGRQDVFVAGTQTNTVKASQLEAIGHDHTVHIGGRQRVRIESGRNVFVGEVDGSVALGGSTSEAHGFGMQTVHGLYVHHVTPMSDSNGGRDENVEHVRNAVRRMLVARASGQSYDPYAPQPPSAEGDDDTADQPSEEREAGRNDLYLETYVVAGRRLKQVHDHEDVELDSRETFVRHGDYLTAGGEVDIEARDGVRLTAHGGGLEVVAGLTLQSSPVTASLSVGRDGLHMTPGGARLERQGRSIVLDDESLDIAADEGVVTVSLGDSRKWGLTLDNEGETVMLVAKNGGSAKIEDEVTITAKHALILKNDGGAQVKLTSGGDVEITGNVIRLRGKVEAG